MKIVSLFTLSNPPYQPSRHLLRCQFSYLYCIPARVPICSREAVNLLLPVNSSLDEIFSLIVDTDWGQFPDSPDALCGNHILMDRAKEGFEIVTSYMGRRSYRKLAPEAFGPPLHPRQWNHLRLTSEWQLSGRDFFDYAASLIVYLVHTHLICITIVQHACIKLLLRRKPRFYRKNNLLHYIVVLT